MTVSFDFPKYTTSAMVFKDGIAITKVLVTITASNTNYLLSLSNDGSTWESYDTSDPTHTFASSAVTNKLYWRIVGEDVNITFLSLEVNPTG